MTGAPETSETRSCSVLLSPVLPATGWGGPALRAWHWLQHLRRIGDVNVVVLPVAGDIDDVEAHRAVTRLQGVSLRVVRPADVGSRGVAGDDVVGGLGPGHPSCHHLPTESVDVSAEATDVVVAFRAATGTLGYALSRRSDAVFVLDLDDDEATMLRQQGGPADLVRADAHDRLVQTLARRAAMVTVSNPREATELRERLGVATTVVANCAPTVIQRSARRMVDASGAATVIMVGNFSSAPDVEGARWFATDVGRHLGRRRRVSLVGPYSAEVATDLKTGSEVTITGTGRLADLTAAYEHADLVVAPLLSGSGTRLEVLESLAYGRPTIGTSVAVDGLGLVDGEHMLVRDDAREFAAAVEHLLSAPTLAEYLTTNGAERARSYSLETIGTDVARRIERFAWPLRRHDLLVTETDEGLILLDEDTGQVCSLNPAASVVFELCTGDRRVSDISAALAQVFGLPQAPVGDVGAVVASLASYGLLVCST